VPEEKKKIEAEDIEEECRRRAENWHNIEPVKPMTKTDQYIVIGIVLACIVAIVYCYLGVFPNYVP